MRFLDLRHLFAATLVFLGTFFSSYASHVVNADIYYTHIAGNAYKVVVDLYVACGYTSIPIDMAINTPMVTLYDNNSNIATFALSLEGSDTGVEVAAPCAIPVVTQCNSLTSAVPGIKKFVYSSIYNLPYNSTQFTFVYNGYNGDTLPRSGRAELTNIYNGSIISISAALNGIVGNSSAVVQNIMPTYFCINEAGVYNPDIIDPDGDSIAIAKVPAMDAQTGTTASYIPPYTYALPLAATGFSYSTTTGVATFVPNLQQRSLLVYRISEYRAHVFVGSTTHEMTVVAATCSNPCSLATPSIAKQNELNIYPNPATEELNITLDGTQYSKMIITDAVGQIVYEQKLHGAFTTVSVAGIPNGLYYITLQGEQGKIVQQISVLH